MKQVLVGILFGLVSASWACAQKGDDMKKSIPSIPKMTREYLLAHGFEQSATDSDIYHQEHARLADAARDLGFSLKDLRPTLNQDIHSDARTVKVNDLVFVVASEVRDKNGKIVRGSLDNPDAICTISVSFLQVPVREYAKTDSVPRLRIKSVEMPNDTSKPWQITFELSATGKKPVAISQGDFRVRVTRKAAPPLDICIYLLFPEQTPKIITVSPGKPTIFTVDVPPDAIPEDLLSSGEYALQIVISAGKRQKQTVDYEWQGTEHSSDKYKFVMK